MASHRSALVRSATINEKNLEIEEHQNVINMMKALLGKGWYSDVTLVVGEKTFPAHRLVLIANSEVFRTQLNTDSNNENSEVTLDIGDAKCQDCFGEFLKFLYCGEACITQNNVMPLFILSEKYNIQKLLTTCRGFFTKNVSAITNGNMIKWLPKLRQNGRHDTYTICKEFLQNNFAIACNNESFLNIDDTFLMEILQSSDLVIPNEELLFGFLEKWLCSKQNDEGYSELVQKIITLIRFPMMTSEGREKVLSSDLCEKFTDVIVQRLRLAAKAQLGTLESCLQASNGLNAEILNPRIYTSKDWVFTLEISDADTPDFNVTNTFVKRSLDNVCHIIEFSVLKKPKVELKCRLKVFPLGRHIIKGDGQIQPSSPNGNRKENQVDVSLEVLDIYGKLNAKISILHYVMSPENIIHVANVNSWYHWFSQGNKCIDIDNIHVSGNPTDCYIDSKKHSFLFAINVS